LTDLSAINFETAGECTLVGGAAITSGTLLCGNNYLKCLVAGDYGKKTFAAQTLLYARGEFILTKLFGPDSSSCADFLEFYGGGVWQCSVMGRKQYGQQGIWVNSYGGGFATANYNFQVGVKYTIEMAVYKAVAGWTKVWINDVLVVEVDENTSGKNSIDEVRFGEVETDGGYGSEIDVDDIAIANTGPIGSHKGFNFNAETGDFSQFDSMVGSPTIESSKRHCGNNGALATLTAYTSQGATINLGHQKEIFLQFYVQIGTSPASGKYVELARISRASDDIMKIRLYNDAGTVKWGFFYRHNGSLLSAYSGTSSNPATATWIRVQARIRCSTVDGDASGIYDMWIDGVNLADITKTTRDTDYTGVTLLDMVATTDNPSATVYWDCLVWDTVAEAAHAAGSSDTATPYTEPSDCIPQKTQAWLQIFNNCQLTKITDFSLKQEQHGIGSITVPYDTNLVKSDLVHVFAAGVNLLQGRVTTVDPDRAKGTRTAQVQTKSARLYTKYCLSSTHQVYSLVDAGYIVYDLINYYFNGLFTTNNINQATGITVQAFDCTGKSVGAAIDDLNTRANTCCYIDPTNDVHYYVAGDESSSYVLNPNDIDYFKATDLSPLCGKVIVKGNGVWGYSGSGLPEVMVDERRISSATEAQQVADALYALYGSGRLKRIEVRVKGFYALKQGLSLVLNYPKERYTNSVQTVQDVTYKLSPPVSTTIFLGDKQPSLEWLLRDALTQIQSQNVSRVSDHTGSATVITDPLLTYNDLLNLGAGSNTAVSAAGKTTIRTGTCGTESNPSSLVYVETVLGYVSGAFTGSLSIEDSGGTVYHDWEITMDSVLTSRKKTCKLPIDLSGKTMNLRMICRSGDSGSMNATLKIRQFIQHAHSMSQSDKHKVD
jgi:hypothetical protein